MAANATATSAAWERAGKYLKQRRVELDPRYRSRALFARERSIDYRLSYDIETAARTNYRDATLTAIDLAYGLEPGFIQRLVNGDDPRRPPVESSNGHKPGARGDTGAGPPEDWIERLQNLPADERDRWLGIIARRSNQSPPDANGDRHALLQPT